MEISNLVIEVTRKCNMTCDHCLRGTMQIMEQKKENIDILLEQITYIGIVTFSGGEPSLNVPIMEYFLEVCKHKRIEVGSFYIATNGLNIKEDFIIFCIKMYSYCNDKEMCSVEISNDMFHSDCGEYDSDLLQALTFFSKRNNDDYYDYDSYSNLIKQGNSEHGRKINENVIEDEDSLNDTDFYLNCKGQIINGCDWSYRSQSNHVLCDVKDFQKWYESVLLEVVVEP